MILVLLGCAPEERPALPAETVAEGVRVEGPQGALVTQALTLVGRRAEAAETAAVKDEDGVPLAITSAKSSWDLKARSARFEDHVVLTRGDVTLTCSTLDVVYAGDRIDHVVADGTVRVVRGGRTAEATHAELAGKSGQITLTGHPKLSEGPNTLMGTTITLWLDDERATCEGAGGEPCQLVVAPSALR